MAQNLSTAILNGSMASTAYSASEAAVYDKNRFTSPCGKRIHRFELDRLLWAVEHIPASSRLLELGCGTGRLLAELLERGLKVDGADASAAMLQQLNKKAVQLGKNVSTTVVEAAKTGFADDHYDLTYAIRLLNQTESPAYAMRVLREMVRITRPGGYILAEFVNDYRPRWGKAARPHRPQPTRLKPAQVAEVGRQCGAEVTAFRGCFFLGMQAYHAAPPILLPFVELVDRTLSALFPRLCARTYLLFRKSEG